MFKKTFMAFAAAACVLTVGPARAAQSFLFNSLGDSLTLDWIYNNVDGADLNATASISLTSWTTSSAIFAVTVTNNTTVAQPGTNRIVSFGIDIVTPSLSTATATGGWGASINTTFPGFKKVDLCVWDGTGCAGGASGGVYEGLSETFNMTLNFSGNPQTSGVTFGAPYASKWQAVGNTGGSWELAGCIKGTPECGGVTPPQEIPEPGSMALAGLALIGLAVARRRRA